MKTLIFVQAVLRRALWWMWTGVAIGAFCGLIASVLHGAVFFVFLVVTLSFSDFFTALGGLVGSLSIAFLTVMYVSCGIAAGVFAGIVDFFILSCAPHRHHSPQYVERAAKGLWKSCAICSFIGAFCCVASTILLSHLMKNDSWKELYFFYYAYFGGAIGGFAIGLFRGALRILREEAQWSTR